MNTHQELLDQQLFSICGETNINLEELENILKQGANPNSLHTWKNYTDHYTGEYSSRFSTLHILASNKNPIEAAEILLNYGASLLLEDPHSRNTVLLTTLSLSNEQYALFLIQKIKESQDVKIKRLLDQKDHKEPDWLNSPLILAFKKGKKNIVHALIEAGADVNQTDRYGSASIHWAALWGWDDTIIKLIEKGANVHARTLSGRTAFEFYRYEIGPLDKTFLLNMIEDSKIREIFDEKPQKHSKFGKVIFCAGLQEISDCRFHGFHRSTQFSVDKKICTLLETDQVNTLSLDEQYIQNFKTSDATARTAEVILGYEYEKEILPILISEGKKFYGPFGHKLPHHTTANLFSEKPIRYKNYEQIFDEIEKAIKLFKVFNDPKVRSNEKKRTFFTKRNESEREPQKNSNPSNVFPEGTFFSNTIVSDKLEYALKNGNVQAYINEGYTTYSELFVLQENKPWIIGALRCNNIRQGIYNNDITIKQLISLSEEQVQSLLHNFHGEQLSLKVAEYLSFFIEFN